MTWDVTKPADAANVVSGDDYVRELEADLQSILSTEHSFPNNVSSPTVKHSFEFGNTTNIATLSASQTGRWYLNTQTGIIQRYNGATWDNLVPGAVLASGTKTFFFQNSVPVGWTRDASFDDCMLKIVSGGTGGSTGGSYSGAWASTGGALAHTHTGGQGNGTTYSNLIDSGVHSEVGGRYNSNNSGPNFVFPTTIQDHSLLSHAHSISSDTFDHSHSFTFTPAYKDVICGSKD